MNVPMGTATALIFINANNQYIGNLSVSGLNVLPLVNLSDGENTVIDLASLTLDGTSVIPSNNPIGSKIMISLADVELMKELGSYYEAIGKNIDTDNDGIPDNINNKQIIVSSKFTVEGGLWGLNNTNASVLDTSRLKINYGIRIKGWNETWSANRNISFKGPAGNPYNDIVKNQEDYNADCGCWDAGFTRLVQNTGDQPSAQPFKAGTYTFSVDGINNHTIYYSGINAKYFLLLAVPVFETDNNGKITKVHVDYMLPDKTPVETSKYISTVALFIRNKGTLIHQEGSMFDIMHVLPDFNDITLSKDVNINDIDNMSIDYTDLVGNIYSLNWKKQ
jgi:hypothetical protein